MFINGIDFRNGIVRGIFVNSTFKALTKVEVKSPPKSKTVGYKLKVAELASDKIPAYIKVEDTEPFVFSDDDDICHWTNHEEIRGLYVADVVQIDGSIEPVELQ